MVIAETHAQIGCREFCSQWQHPDIHFWLHTTTFCHIYVQKQQTKTTCMKISLYNPFMGGSRGVSQAVPGSPCYREGTLVAWGGLLLFSRGRFIASLCPRSSVRGEEPYPTSGDPVVQNTAYLKQQTLKNNPQSYGVSAVPKGWMAVGESVFNGTLWDTRRPPSCI